jgi:NADPH:quinone reductase
MRATYRAIQLLRNSAQRTRCARLLIAVYATMQPRFAACALKGKGGLDQLQEVELPLDPPKQGEIRTRVRASGVGGTDITKRTGYYPYSPPFPFVEGYEAVADVDAIGPGVSGFVPGQRVCALTVYGA